MSTSTKTNAPIKSSYWIHVIVFLILMIGIGLLPPFGQVTEYGMDILGIFIGLIYGWTFIGFLWPSLFGLVALGYTDFAANVTTATANGFGESLVWQVFFMMIFADILRRLGLTEFIGYWLLSRKICVGKPWILIFLIFTTAFICGGIISLYGTIFMLWAICYNIFEICGYEKRSMLCTYIIGGIVYMVAMSCMVFPFRPYPSVVLGLCAKAGATSVPFVPWLIIGLLTAFGMILLYLLIGKFLFRFDLSSIANMGDMFAEKRNAKMNSDTKLGAVILALFVLTLIAVGLLPASIPFVAFLKKADMLGLALITICISLVWRKKSGEPLMKFSDLTQAVSWDIIIMFAVTLPVSGALGTEETGIMTTVMQALMPIINGLSPLAFVAATIIVLGLITQVAHNLVLTMAFTPLLAQIAAGFGINPILYGFLLVTMLQCAVATPAASAQSAMVFANSEWVNEKFAYVTGISFAILSMVILICIAFPIGTLLF